MIHHRDGSTLPDFGVLEFLVRTSCNLATEELTLAFALGDDPSEYSTMQLTKESPCRLNTLFDIRLYIISLTNSRELSSDLYYSKERGENEKFNNEV